MIVLCLSGRGDKDCVEVGAPAGGEDRMNRIDIAFRAAKKANRAAFMPFLTAGDPNLDATSRLLVELEKRGADLIELGIPYSDPIADGPTIQASYGRALGRGLKMDDVFAMMAETRKRCNAAMLAMVSFSIIQRIGPETFFRRAAESGIDGVILPDLPADQGAETAKLCQSAGLHPVFLVAPTTSDERMKLIGRLSTGFIYYVSVAGITGARTELPADLAEHLARLKALTSRPVAVGFGISTPEHVRRVAQIADGVIVGSAIVRKVQEHADLPVEELAVKVGEFAGQLAEGAKRPAG